MPFNGVILNRRKSGDLFMNLVNLQGLVVAKNPRGDSLWFVVGIQADVTDLCLETTELQVPRLNEVARIIREKLTAELSTMAMSSAMIAEKTLGKSSCAWWLLPDPVYTSPDQQTSFSRQKTLFDTVMETEFGDLSDDEFAAEARPRPGLDRRLSSFARQQSQHVDTLLPNAMALGDIDEVMREAVKDCNFSVSIGDPRAFDCPLVAVSDQFEALTGYSRDEIIGKNCRFLGRNCPLGEQDQTALRQACMDGSPFCKIIVNRRKSGDLFLNLVDLRGVTLARNLRTREELWFLVGIQADVTYKESSALPKDHLESIHQVASCIRTRMSDQLALMALAGSSSAGCLSDASGEEEVLWVPVDAPKWMKGAQSIRQASPEAHLQWRVERVRQTSSCQGSTSRQASHGRSSQPVGRLTGDDLELGRNLAALPAKQNTTWELTQFRSGLWLIMAGLGSLVLWEMSRTKCFGWMCPWLKATSL
ncbi:unnamed protein product [Effrenium voratum]|nr:unnamed protein product [Effrenium voratum]